jgi:hypothetical protein
VITDPCPSRYRLVDDSLVDCTRPDRHPGLHRHEDADEWADYVWADEDAEP